MLSLRSNTCCRAPTAARRAPAPRRPVVAVRAGLGDALNNIGQAFVKIFSPPADNAPNGNWSGTTNAFTGRINHHGPGRPFKDGFAGSKAAATEASGAAAAAVEEAADQAAGFMDGAIQSVMNKNFAGKEDENLPTTGAEGWKGDLHGRKRDGFHLPRN